MAVHRVRISLDTDIPEHRAIWEQISGLSTHGRLQFLRTHLYRSIEALGGSVVAAVAAPPAALKDAEPQGVVVPPSEINPPVSQASVRSAEAASSTGRKLKPFLGST